MRRAFAVVLLICGWIAPLAMPHAGGDDAVCIPASGDASKSRVAETGVQKAPDHCAICHSARTFRTSVAQGGFLPLGLSPGDHRRGSQH